MHNVFFTDKQLCGRRHCSPMKLWRMRRDGKLRRPVKIGDSGLNLTPGSVVEELENGGDAGVVNAKLEGGDAIDP